MITHLEATLTADDTQEWRIPTRPVIAADFMGGINSLNGHLVIYCHYSDSAKKYYGHIRTVVAGKRCLNIYVEPCSGQGVSLVKPFHMNELALVGG